MRRHCHCHYAVATALAPPMPPRHAITPCRHAVAAAIAATPLFIAYAAAMLPRLSADYAINAITRRH